MRESKARSRARQTKEQRCDEREKARLRMKELRGKATEDEKAVMRVKSAERIKHRRANMSQGERERVRARDRERKSKKRQDEIMKEIELEEQEEINNSSGNNKMPQGGGMNMGVEDGKENPKPLKGEETLLPSSNNEAAVGNPPAARSVQENHDAAVDAIDQEISAIIWRSIWAKIHEGTYFKGLASQHLHHK